MLCTASLPTAPISLCFFFGLLVIHLLIHSFISVLVEPTERV
jgi:hypothetical protein